MIYLFILPLFLICNFIFYTSSLKSKYLQNNYLKIIGRLFAPHPKIGFWLLSLLGVTFLRDFLDLSFEYHSFLSDVKIQMAFTFFWLGAFGSLLLYIALYHKLAWAQSLNIVVFSSLIILSVPVTDLLTKAFFSLPQVNMGFVNFDFLKIYLSFGIWPFSPQARVLNPSIPYGASPGIILELALVASVGGWISTHWHKSPLKGVFTTWFFYSLIFILGAPQLVLKPILILLGLPEIANQETLLYAFLIFDGILIFTISLFTLKFAKFKSPEFLKHFFNLKGADIFTFLTHCRPERVLHYWLIFAIGLFMAPSFTSTPGGIDLSLVILILSALFFAWLFAIGINDEFDLIIDRVSSPNRPLVKGTLTLEKNRILTWLSFICFIFLAAYCERAAHPLLTVVAISFIYSAPPLRLRKYFFLPQILIGLASLAVFYSGLAVRPGFHLTMIPTAYSLCFVFVFALSTLIKDIKDEVGDRKAQVVTFMTWLGPKRGRLAISFCLIMAIALVQLFLLPETVPWIISAVFATLIVSAIHFLSEKYIFILWYLYALALGTYLLKGSQLISL